jgi:hypothetical protein
LAPSRKLRLILGDSRQADLGAGGIWVQPLEAVWGIRHRLAKIPCISATLNDLMQDVVADGFGWRRILRQGVRLSSTFWSEG